MDRCQVHFQNMNVVFRRTIRLTTPGTITRHFSQRRRIQPTSHQRIESVIDKKPRSYPTNHQIPYEVVQVQESDGTLNPSVNLPHLLATVDKSTHLVRLISHIPPIVRVLTHVEDKMNKLERKADMKTRKNKGQVTTKEVRLTWITSDADYEHKMTMARKELEKGDVRIDFLFCSPSGVRVPSRLEVNDQLQKVADSFSDVSNEWKERVVFRGTARLHLQSTVRASKVMPSRGELEELARKSLERSEKSRRQSKKDLGTYPA